MAELIIIFREVFEASLIIGILYTFLKKKENNTAIKQLWRGVNYAIIASIIGSFLFQLLAGGFHGQGEKIFEGIVMIIAAITLSTMIIWMAKNQNISTEIKEKAEESISNDSLGFGIFSLSFIAVFREGIETILFMYGIFMKQGNISIISSLVGAILAIGASYLIFIKGRKMPIKTFFNISSILLIFVASGMLAYGIHELESAGIITDYGRLWDINPEKNIDGTYPLLHDKGYVGSLIKGLFGYNGDPSLIEFIIWICSLTGLLYTYNKIKQKQIESK